MGQGLVQCCREKCGPDMAMCEDSMPVDASDELNVQAELVPQVAVLPEVQAATAVAINTRFVERKSLDVDATRAKRVHTSIDRPGMRMQTPWCVSHTKQARRTAALVSEWHPQDGARGKCNEHSTRATTGCGDSNGCNGLQPRTLSRLDRTLKPHGDRQLDNGFQALNFSSIDDENLQCADTQVVEELQPRTLSRIDTTLNHHNDRKDNGLQALNLCSMEEKMMGDGVPQVVEELEPQSLSRVVDTTTVLCRDGQGVCDSQPQTTISSVETVSPTDLS